jgi:hypothetical protein
MAYAEIIRLPIQICREFGLRERLRCEYLKTIHELRPDFPPDLVLRDREPPDMILKDEILPETYWELAFGEEIVVTPFPYAAWWRTGIRLNDGWNARMRNGEIVVSTEPLAEPMAYHFLDQANFILEVVGGELVYTPHDGPDDQEFFNIAWALFFRDEITVVPWPYVTPMHGIFLAEESPLWALQMIRGEIVLEENIALPIPYLPHKPDRWRFGLEMIAGELVYTPFFEAVP